MLGILLTTLIFIGVLLGSSFMTNIKDVTANWSTYRCRPDIMIMAPIYGKDMVNNMEFCLKNGFDNRASSTTSSFYTYLASFTGVLSTLLGSINSIKMIFATIVGTATTVFSEFAQRMKALLYRVQLTAIRMKFLMSRISAIMNSVIFMGMSGIKAGQNFSNTFLFKFLDTFCFDPDTPIFVKGCGTIPIRDVKIGDILQNNEKVTATFQFNADGQMMVYLDNILVSTNHYVHYNNRWIQAKDHPNAKVAENWSGGTERPLICLNTDTHSFTIGGYTFKDYDETSEGDKEAMEQVTKMLNGGSVVPCTSSDSTMACSPETLLKMYPASGTKLAKDVVLGDELSHGRVVGLVQKDTNSVCDYKGCTFATGTSIWCEEQQKWMRAADLAVSRTLDSPTIFLSFVVTPSATIETASGLMFRDYVEIHSPDLETPYTNAINK